MNKSGWNIKDVPRNYITYELCLLAVTNERDYINAIGCIADIMPHLITIELCKAAIRCSPYSVFSIILRNSQLFDTLIVKELYYLGVEVNGYTISCVPDDIITYELCKTAVKTSGGGAIEYIAKKLPNFMTTELCELAVDVSHGIILTYIEMYGYLTLDMCKTAVKHNKFNMDLVPERFKCMMEE